MVASYLNITTEENISTRDGYGEAVVEAGQVNSNIVVLSADLAESTRSHWFKESFPERFIEMGVAEQNLVTVAAGMAAVGKIPFVASYAVFSPGRNWEQIRITISYNNMPVKIIGSHAGISAGPDGGSHQALEDVGLMRILPNMTVIVPCDYLEARKAVLAAAEHAGPVYVRLERSKTPVFTTTDTPFEIGHAEIFREGSDITIVGAGPLVYKALLAAEELSNEGVQAEVINSSSVKPFDTITLLGSVQKTNAVITIESHQVAGGLGGVVAEVLSENYPVKMKRIGIQDRFGQSGNPDELELEYGLGVEDIIKAAKDLLG